jgi:hypothetical protein
MTADEKIRLIEVIVRLDSGQNDLTKSLKSGKVEDILIAEEGDNDFPNL